MSELLVSTLRDRATNKSLGAERIVDGSVKAWVTSNAQNIIQISLNVTSVTDVAVGHSRANFASPFATHISPSIATTSVNQFCAGFAAAYCDINTANNAGSAEDSWFGLNACGRLA